MRQYLLLTLAIIQLSCSSGAGQTNSNSLEVAARTPFRKSDAVLRTPVSYLKRETKKGAYDPKPTVVMVDEKSGRYELTWIGMDRRKKVVKYQRADALDAVVESSAILLPDGRREFRYVIRVLPTSPTYLSSFTVQTFAKDVKVASDRDIYAGDMLNSIAEFREGKWWRFAVLDDRKPQISPGMSIEFTLSSNAPAGIVECRGTAGNLTLKGAGEDMPSELEAAMPGYEEWAKCYALGPDERLAGLSERERTGYLLENLPKFLAAGWITNGTFKRYESHLSKGKLVDVLSEAEDDFTSGAITAEAIEILRGFRL